MGNVFSRSSGSLKCMFFTVGQPCCIHICLCYCCDDIYCYDDNLTDNDDSENNNGHRIDCNNSKKRKKYIYILLSEKDLRCLLVIDIIFTE